MELEISGSIDVLFLLPTANRKLLTAYESFSEHLERRGVNVTFVDFYSTDLPDSPSFDTLSADDYDFSEYDVLQEARRLEEKYKFSLSRSTYPYLAQKKQKYDFQSDIATNHKQRIFDYLFLEEIINGCNPNFILRNQGTQSAFYFADRISEYNNIPQATFSYEYFGRMVFYKRLYGDNADIHPIQFNPHFSKNDTVNFLQNKIFNSDNTQVPTIYNSLGDHILDNYRNPKELFDVSTHGITWIKRELSLRTPRGRYRVKNILKPALYQEPSENDTYAILPLHTPLESTEVHRAHPYVDPEFITKILSRNLPVGHDLYVREHPHHQSKFSYSLLNYLSQIPNVHVADPTINVEELISNAEFVIAFNNTTGYESLFLETPVLALAPSPYSTHDHVTYTNNLFGIDQQMVQVSNHSFDRDSVMNFLTTMMRCSIDISMGSKINDEEDPESVGSDFASYILELYNNIC